MRNRFTLFLMLMFLMGTGMNAQTVVAKMKALADAAGNSDATKATVSTVWQSDDAEGAVYEFSDGKYLGAISNAAVVSALEGDKYVTIAMWVYGRTTGNQCVFGYGNVNDGVKFQQNGKYISATRKGRTDIGGWSRDELLDDEWNLIAFAVAGKTNTTATTGKYYINNINDNHSDLKLSSMATTADGNQFLAIGSGDQNTARETYNGMIANLTVITSDELLTNDQIKTYVGTVSRIDGKRRVTINYNYGNGTFSQKILVTPSTTFDVPTPDFYTNVQPATINDDNSSTSYNVTCVENFPFTAGTFYKLKLREKEDNTRYVVWDGTSANINTRKSAEEATNAGMGSYWRFERVPNTENQVRLFTNCKGKSQAVTFTNMATNEQAATLTDNGTIFMVKTGNSDYTDPKGFRLSSLTNDDYNVNDVNGTLSVWASALSKDDGGSTFTVYDIDAQPTEVTSATCTDENGITATYNIASKGYYWNGTASDAVSAPVLPGYMAATTARITAEGALSFDYTNNYPFVVSTDNAKYFQSLRVRNDATHYVTATYNSGNVAAGTTKSRDNGIATDETKQGIMQSGWAFVKEPGTINKFRIYNEATGNLQLYLQNQNNSTAATMAASGTAFVVELQPTEFTAFTGGFTIRVNENDSHALGDHGNGALAYWCNRGSSELNDNGSIFRVADADVWVEQVYTDFVTNGDAWVASLVNQEAASLPAYTTAKTAAATVISNQTSTNAQKMQAYRKVAQSLYTAKTNLLAEADATQIYKLRSLTNSGDLYLHVKNNDNKGVIITQPIRYLRNQMFQFVKNETSGKYAIKCIADNSMLLNSTGTNYWDVKSSTDTQTPSEYTLGNVYNGNYTISKDSEDAGKYLSPDNTRKADGTYIIYSNLPTANAWALEPVSATDADKGEDANYKALYDLYLTYLPYKNLYVAEKAGLPGYPTSYTGTAPAVLMDDQLKSAETLLNKPTGVTSDEVELYRYMFPYVLENLQADLVNYPENRYFSIKNTDNRGYFIYAADAPKGGSGEEWNYVWSTGKSYNVTNGEGTTSVSVTFDASNPAHLWCFLNHTKVDGTAEHYLYNVGLKKYARPTKVVGTYNGYTWVLTDEPAPITLQVYDAPNHKMAITAKSTEVASDKVVYASISNAYTGPVINYYTQTDGGVPFTFDWGTVEFAASDTTAVAALVRTPITLRSVVKATNPLITGLDDNQSICTYSSTKAFRVPTGVTAYYATRRDDNNIVRLKTVPDGIVPANQGVLLVGAVNKTQAMLDVDYRTEVTAESNIFSNTASGATPMGANCYVLANSTEGIGFYHATAGTTLSQGKAYLDFSGSSVRAFTLSFGDEGPTTGISSINADGNAENAPIYDLSGRRIAEPLGRGIYIKNGKKYYVK
ncbi:MAG: hypothetical protein PUH44_04015 [Bacteroidales bacterium]|nr:hypothetical protein [Bacteroidales bacterium]MDD7232813.1 hypothetical protein [Bacteroidales bacterium]MDY2705756.1 hypothetical protein [Alloprevotella sp.]